MNLSPRTVAPLLLFLTSTKLLASQPLRETRPTSAAKAELKKVLGVRAPDFKYDKRMITAAAIAVTRAARSPQYHCWRNVKVALLKANVIQTYPKTVYAKQAARELQASYGFRKLPIKDPFQAPYGSVLVYGGAGPGHVEFRSGQGFVSDFISSRPSSLPLLGIYVKSRS